MKSQQKPFSLRVSEDLMQYIKTEADKQGRSVDKQIEFWLKEKADDNRRIAA